MTFKKLKKKEEKRCFDNIKNGLRHCCVIHAPLGRARLLTQQGDIEMRHLKLLFWKLSLTEVIFCVWMLRLVRKTAATYTSRQEEIYLYMHFQYIFVPILPKAGNLIHSSERRCLCAFDQTTLQVHHESSVKTQLSKFGSILYNSD